jgi:hypothetical protein
VNWDQTTYKHLHVNIITVSYSDQSRVIYTRYWRWRLLSSATGHRLHLHILANVSEESTATIIMVGYYAASLKGEQGMGLRTNQRKHSHCFPHSSSSSPCFPIIMIDSPHDLPFHHVHKGRDFQKQTNSVALSPRANYTDWSIATCRRNLVPTFVYRGVSRGQRGGSLTVVNLSFLDRSGYFSFK